MKSKKTKIIIAIVLAILFALATIGIIVWYKLIPDQFVAFWLNVWAKANDPLPIVGVSILTICLFAWRVYASSSYGKKQVAKVKGEFEKTKQGIKEYEEQSEIWKKETVSFLESECETLKNEVEFYKEIIKQICELSPNKKIKALGEKVYGGEKETDCITETKDI